MKLKHIRIKLRLILKKLILDIRHTHLKDLRNLFLTYLKKLPDVIHLKNLVLFNSILAIIILVLFTQRFNSLDALFQKIEPDFGGVYREGVIGSIEKVNPLFIQSHAEESASKLIFSGLTRVLPNNQVTSDLAEKWDVNSDGTVYDFKLKKNLKWHDGKKLTADDVVFTINLIENPDTRTNRSAIWRGIKVEKVSDIEVKFTLPNPYPDFPQVAAEPILPAHLLSSMDPKNVKISEFNHKPIGSGPYTFVRFDQAGNEPEVVLAANKDFALGKPYISEVRLRSYESFDALNDGFTRKQIDTITEIPFEDMSKVDQLATVISRKSFLPRYKTMIINLKNEILSDKTLRKAISQVINRDQIMEKAIYDQGETVYAPILPGQIGYDPKYRSSKVDVKAANESLDKAGWALDKGVRKKGGKELTFSLITTNDSEDVRASKEIQKELVSIGVKVNLVNVDMALIQADYIRPRNFDLLLIGENTTISPDLYSFLHSSQISDPGLNLSGLKDRALDKYLEQAKKTNDPKVKSEKYKQIQDVLADQVPEIYLYNPVFSIAISKNVKGISKGKLAEPGDHLNDIYKWYIKEKTR